MKQQKKERLPLRINILFFIVFLFFAALIYKLGVVQVLDGESYQKEINHTVKETTEQSVPRGEIYDRNHDQLVENDPLYSITYTPSKGAGAEDRLNSAKKLSEFLTMYDKDNKQDKFDTITSDEKKEYWYINHEEEAKQLLSDQEAANLDPDEQQQAIMDRIEKEEVNDLSDEEKNMLLIKKEMDKAQSLTPQVVKNEDVTSEEYAKVAEHLQSLPGVDASTDWDRKYPHKDTLESILGSITSQNEGIPSEKVDEFLARGYNRNDRVGRSGLEEEYESLLQGRKEQKEYMTNRENEVTDSKVAVEGERGKDLVLSVDVDFQEKVDKIVRDELKKVIKKYPHDNRFTEDATAVVMNPKTGELLAVSGQHYDRDKNKFYNQSNQALNNQNEIGSAVKGATVLAGYQSEAIKPGTKFKDEPMKIAGTPEKSSWKNLGVVDDLHALRQSSNVYMFHVALRMGGEYNYKRNEPVSFDPGAFQELRNYYEQFGLGVSTGIDYPNESTGYEGTDPQAGNLQDFSIGQFDTYTTMQLAQYISTIANDGERVQPHFLKEARSPSAEEDDLGPVFDNTDTRALNQLEMKQAYIERVQEGFRQVYQETGGTAYEQFADKDYDPAGKTGTAQTKLKKGDKVHDTENNSLVGYAPFDNPEIAIAIMVPHTGEGKGDDVNNKIGEKIMDAYFDMKKEDEND